MCHYSLRAGIFHKLLSSLGVVIWSFSYQRSNSRVEPNTALSQKFAIMVLLVLVATFACDHKAEQHTSSGKFISEDNKSSIDSLETAIKMWDRMILNQQEIIKSILDGLENKKIQHNKDSVSCPERLKNYQEQINILRDKSKSHEKELQAVQKTIDDKELEKEYEDYAVKSDRKMENIDRIINELKYYQPQINQPQIIDLQLSNFRREIDGFREDFMRCKLELPQLPIQSPVTEIELRRAMNDAVYKFDDLNSCLELERQKRKEQTDAQEHGLQEKRSTLFNELQKVHDEIDSLSRKYEDEFKRCGSLEAERQKEINLDYNKIRNNENLLISYTSQKSLAELFRNKLEFEKLELRSQKLIALYDEIKEHERHLLNYIEQGKWDAAERLSRLVDARLQDFRQSLSEAGRHNELIRNMYAGTTYRFHFEIGRPDKESPREELQPYLQVFLQLFNTLMLYLEHFPDTKIYLDGHADRIEYAGKQADKNVELSKGRVEHAREYLKEAHIPDSIIVMDWYSKFHNTPLDSKFVEIKGGQIGGVHDRRVEVRVFNKKASPGKIPEATRAYLQFRDSLEVKVDGHNGHIKRFRHRDGYWIDWDYYNNAIDSVTIGFESEVYDSLRTHHQGFKALTDPGPSPLYGEKGRFELGSQIRVILNINNRKYKIEIASASGKQRISEIKDEALKRFLQEP